MYNKANIVSILAIALWLFSPLCAAITPASITGFEREGVNLKMNPASVKSTLEANGYTLRREWTNIPEGGHRTSHTFGKGDRKSQSRVQLDYYDEKMVRLTVSLPGPGRGGSLQPELERLRQYFGDAMDQCNVREKKGAIKRVKCKFTATSPTRNYNFSFDGTLAGYSYILSDKYDPGRAYAKKNREKTLSRYACLQTFDPKDLDQVFACLGSLRQEQGVFKGKNILEGRLGACSQARAAYFEFLEQHSLISVQDLNALRRNDPAALQAHRVPDCAMFARVGQELTGKPLRWAACVGYQNSTAHLKQCLDIYLPATYGSKENAQNRVKTCEQLQKEYRYALKLASPGGMPPGFAPLDCEQAMLAWRGGPRVVPVALKACDGYELSKGSAHVEACLADDPRVLQMRTCIDVRRAYEARLEQAYGQLPRNYVVMRCSYADAVLARAEREREAAMERMRAEQARLAEIRRKQAEASNKYWNEILAKGQRSLDALDVETGPLVDQNALAPVRLEGKEGGSSTASGEKSGGRDLFRRFEQPGILKALYHGRQDLLQAKRRDILVYLGTFGATLGGGGVAMNYPECRPYFPASSIQRIQDELLAATGMGAVLSASDAGQAGVEAIGTSMALLREVMTNGYGKLYQGTRNIDLLKSMAENDAYRFAGTVGCESGVSDTVRKNALDFISQK